MARRLLIVDDDDDLREVARLSLEMTAGWEVDTAASGAEGVDAAASRPPDAILLDVMMPEMDGPDTLRALRARTGGVSIPVILLTARTQEADRRRFAALDVAGVLVKPFDPMSLAEQVAGLLGWPPPP